MILSLFTEVWLVDFEFHQPSGDRPQPLCMVAREFKSGRTIRLWKNELCRLESAPFATNSDSLLVAYYASAELGCFSALNWPMPRRILDLYAEFKCQTSGMPPECGHGLLGAMAFYGLDSIEGSEKDSMRELAMRGGEYTPAEREALLAYCETDVIALSKLLPAMLPKLDMPRALLRGRYMTAVARIEWAGVSIDIETFNNVRGNWETIQERLIAEVDKEFNIYEGRTFKTVRFAEYLTRENIPWPHLPSGSLALDDDTFKDMAKSYPQLYSLRELRHTLGELRLNDLAVGMDGRNRCLLSPFKSKTGRNQPSNSKFIFGPSVWTRGLIRAMEGRAIAYLDWEQQEFGIAAALSGDDAMIEAYRSGDPYLSFAKQAGAVPNDATKASHPKERDQFKVCALAVQYGMGETSLAMKLNQPPIVARELLRLHRQTYPKFWRWSEAVVDHAMLHGFLKAVFGWTVHVGPYANPRSLANFPMQANGAEMLRLACCLTTEAGISVCAPVHDAILIEGQESEIEGIIATAESAMGEASEIVLSGFRLRTEAKIFRHPDRYMDDRGRPMWNTVMKILESISGNNVNEPTCT